MPHFGKSRHYCWISEDTHVSANTPGVSDRLCCTVVQFPLGFYSFGPTLCRWRAPLTGSKCGNDKIEIQNIWISLELKLDTIGLIENPAGFFPDPSLAEFPQPSPRPGVVSSGSVRLTSPRKCVTRLLISPIKDPGLTHLHVHTPLSGAAQGSPSSFKLFIDNFLLAVHQT